MSLLGGTVPWERPCVLTPLCAPWEVTHAVDELGFYSLHWWLISKVFEDEEAFGCEMQCLFFGYHGP